MKARFAVVLAVLVFVCLVVPATVLGQEVKTSAVKTGWWHNASTWNPPGVPSLADTVIIQAGHRIHVQYWANGRVIINNGIIDHPLGHITSDKRVRILLMVGAVDSIINNGGIYGYNARGGSTHASEFCPTSVLLTCTGGDPVIWPPDRPIGKIVNNGVIRAGDAFRRRGLRMPGGAVIARGRPARWPFLYPDVEFTNSGEVSGGRGRGSSWGGFGGGTLIGISPFWPHRPFSEIENRGVIQGGRSGLLGGWTWLVSRFPGLASVVDSDGGRVLGGENVTPTWTCWAMGDTISFSGAGTAHAGGRFVIMSRSMWPWNCQEISLANLDPDAIHAVPTALAPQLGGVAWWYTLDTDARGNAAGTTVIRADDGTMNAGAIYAQTRTLQIDPDVQLRDITSPPTDPMWWLRDSGADLARRENGNYDPELLVVPSGNLYNSAIYDSTLTGPQYDNRGSPGDTASVWAFVASNQQLDGDIEVTASDSLGFPILNSFQIVRNDTIALSTVRVDVFIPNWAQVGSRNRITVRATYSDDPSVYHEIPLDLYVVPTANVVAPYAHDGFFIPEEGGARVDSVAYEFVVRNEGRIGTQFEFEATAARWEVHTEILSMWMEARSESVNTVWVKVPEGTPVGETDTVFLTMDNTGSPDYPDTSWFDVTYVGGTGVSGASADVGHAVLAQNAPNPFNPRTEIRFTLPVASEVTLDVYDVSGRHVRSLAADQEMTAGEHSLAWDGLDDDSRRVVSGVYFCRLRAGAHEAVRKMILLK